MGSQLCGSLPGLLLQPSAAQELAMEVFLGCFKRKYFANVHSLNNFSFMTLYFHFGREGASAFFKYCYWSSLI